MARLSCLRGWTYQGQGGRLSSSALASLTNTHRAALHNSRCSLTERPADNSAKRRPQAPAQGDAPRGFRNYPLPRKPMAVSVGRSSVKCVHCSAPVERNEWFCPNCKRSLPRPVPARHRRGSAAVWLTTAALSLLGGTLFGSRFPASRAGGRLATAADSRAVSVTARARPPAPEDGR